MRTSRSVPSAVFAHHDRPSPCSYPAAAASISADTAPISSSVNTPAMWRKPASARKCPIARGSSSMWKARARSSGSAVGAGEGDRTGRVHRPRVDQTAQDHPPVEEVVEPSRRHVEVAAGEEAHRGAEVVHDVGQVLLAEPHVRGRAARPRTSRSRGRRRARASRSGRRPPPRAAAARARGRRRRRAIARSRARRGSSSSKNQPGSTGPTSAAVRVRTSTDGTSFPLGRTAETQVTVGETGENGL